MSPSRKGRLIPMSLAVGSFAMIIKPPMVLGIQTVGTARRREGSRKNGDTRGVACVAGVRKGRGRESGRETTRAQFPASPSPFNACHAGYSGRSARSSEDGRGGERKESLPTRFKFLLLFRPVPSYASAPPLPRLTERKQKRLRSLRDRYLDHEALDLTYIFSVLAIFVGFASLYILL